MKKSILLSIGALTLFTSVTIAKEIPPGHLINPDGLQRFQGAAYNSERDEYLIIYQGGDSPRVRRLGTNGNFLAPEVRLDKAIGVANVHVVYNPDDNQYLAIYRSDTAIFGRYLDALGVPLAPRFRIGTGGEVGRAAYSRKSRRYLVVWRKGPKPIQVLHAVIHGDSTASNPVVKSGSLANGDNAHAAWGSVKNKFLVVYTREVGTAKEEVFGKLVNGNGSGSGSEFKIMGGPKAQTGPQVGYASSEDVFLVSVSDWRNVGCCRADVVGQRLDSAGNKLGSRFNIVATGNGGWDVTGPIGFNEATGQFLATSYVEPFGYAREIDPGNGSRQPKVELANELSVPIAVAMRPHPSDPQALILTRSNLGGNGVHAHILHLTAGPPTFTSNELPDGGLNVPYSEKASVAGGTLPLTFELLSPASALAPGIKGPDPDTGIFSGQPTAAGTYSFEVEVTDQEGRSAKASLTHTIRLAAPNLSSPVSVAISERKPTFEWTSVPGATSYHLVVENLTGGGTAINESKINGTSFTPGSNLPAGKLFQWRVRALGGGADGPFSPDALFEIDTAPPTTIELTGTVPETLSEVEDLTAIDTSSEHKEKKKMENLVDGKNKTSWMSKGTAKNVSEHVTVDLGATVEVHQIALRSKRAPRFPQDFEIQISSQPDAGFTTLVSTSAFQANGNTWYPFATNPTWGRYVKILVTKKGVHRGKFWAEISELEVSGVSSASGTIEFHWQAPADDEGSGMEPVVEYDLRLMPGDASTFDYQAATPVADEPPPELGAQHSLAVDGLLDETQYAAAITSLDDAGNRSPLSNVVVLSTPGIPPGVIADLRASDPSETSLELEWTAPAEDGNQGGAVTQYDLRYSQSPIDADNFDQATQVEAEPAPAAPGTKQSMTIANLASSTRHYFAIRSRDDVGSVSLISNLASGTTLDGVPPAAVTDLAAEPGGVTTSQIASLDAIDASSERTSKGFFKEHLVDGDNDTHWCSGPTATNVEEYITVDLGGTFDVAEIRLRSDSNTAEKFPTDFDLQISDSPGGGFTTVASASAFTATPSTWYDFKVTPTSGRYVRVFVTKKSLRKGSYWVQLAEIQVVGQSDLSDGFVLTWTATGDDEEEGTADSYDVRYSHQEILDESDFDNEATKVNDALVPEPQPAGFPESLSIGGFGQEEVLWIAMKVEDDNGNVSDLSNVLKVATPGIPPGAVSGLEVVDAAATGTTIRLRWIAPADDAGDATSGPVDHYDLRCSTSPIPDAAVFDALPSIVPGPIPATPGTTQTFDVPDLANQTLYYCRMRAVDDADLVSDSGVTVQGSTIDAIPPDPVSNLEVRLNVGNFEPLVEVSAEHNSDNFRKDNATDGDSSTRWSTPGRTAVTTDFLELDFGTSVDMNLVRLQAPDGNANRFPRDFTVQLSDDGANYTIVHTETDFVATDGVWYEVPLGATSARYVKIESTDQNLSFGKYFTQIAEVEVSSPSGPLLHAILTWSAPGDDGNEGNAASYEIRHSTIEIDEDNFPDAILPPGATPVPQPPGSQERFLIGSGLTAGARNWFAIQTSDDQGNTSLAVISAVADAP